jgi:hypothetical protein
MLARWGSQAPTIWQFSALMADGEPSRQSPRSMMILYAVEAQVNDVAEEVGGIWWGCNFFMICSSCARAAQNGHEMTWAWAAGTTRGLQKLQGIHYFCNHLCNFGCKKTARIMQRRLGSWHILWSESLSVTCVLIPPQICNMGCKSGLTSLYLL